MQQQLEIIVSFKQGTGNALPKIEQGARSVLNSVDGLNTKIKHYTKVAEKADLGSVAYTKALKNVDIAQKQLASSMINVNKNMQQTTRGSANMTMALQATNFTIRDSPYFFRDFSLGILAVGNNLNPMIDSIIAVKREMGGWKGAFSAFAKQMMGPSGVIMGFSILITAIQAVTFAMAKNKSEVNEGADAWQEYADKATRASRGMMQAQIKFQQSIIDADREAYEKRVRLAKEGKAPPIFDVYKMSEEAQKAAELIKKLQDELAILGDIENLERKITEARELQSKVKGNQELREALQRDIESYELQIKSMRGISKSDGKERIITIKDLIETDEELLASITQLEKAQEGLNVSDRESLALTKLKIAAIERLGGMQSGVLDLIMGQADQDYTLGQFQPTGEIQLSEGAKKILEDGKPLPALEEVKKDMSGINQLANTLGSTIYNAFSQGKFAADQFLLSLISIAAQMTIIEGLKALFSGGAYSMFSFLGFNQGGIAKASGGYITGGNGTHDFIPALLRPKEMVLNPNQQAELFNMAKGINYGGGGQTTNVRITGTTIEKKSSFVTKWRSAEKQYNNTRGINNVSRS